MPRKPSLQRKLNMKTRLSILLSVLALTIFVNAGTKAQMMKMSGLPDVIAKPVFEGSDGGVLMKVWIMSIIRDLGNVDAKADNDDINDTHNVLVEVEDKDGNIIPDEVVRLLLVSPSGKKQSVDLDPKSDQYGGSVAFTETGEYQLTVSVNAVSLNADGKPAQSTFNYKFYR